MGFQTKSRFVELVFEPPVKGGLTFVAEPIKDIGFVNNLVADFLAFRIRRFAILTRTDNLTAEVADEVAGHLVHRLGFHRQERQDVEFARSHDVPTADPLDDNFEVVEENNLGKVHHDLLASRTVKLKGTGEHKSPPFGDFHLLGDAELLLPIDAGRNRVRIAGDFLHPFKDAGVFLALHLVD